MQEKAVVARETGGSINPIVWANGVDSIVIIEAREPARVLCSGQVWRFTGVFSNDDVVAVRTVVDVGGGRGERALDTALPFHPTIYGSGANTLVI